MIHFYFFIIINFYSFTLFDENNFDMTHMIHMSIEKQEVKLKRAIDRKNHILILLPKFIKISKLL